MGFSDFKSGFKNFRPDSGILGQILRNSGQISRILGLIVRNFRHNSRI